MSDMELNPAQQKARKKKLVILGVLVAGSALTWSRTLLGGDDGKAPPAAPAPPPPTPTAASAATAAGAAAAAAASGTRISDFETAKARIALWSQALDRQVHEGPITAPEQGFEDGVFGTPEPEEPEPQIEPDPEPVIEEVVEAPIVLEPDPEPEPEPVRFADLGLELSSTCLFGDRHWAVIERQRTTAGREIVVRFDGRDVSLHVVAVRPRSVDVEYLGVVHTLTMDPPDLDPVTPDDDTQGDAGAESGR